MQNTFNRKKNTNVIFILFLNMIIYFFATTGERYDFVINADQAVGAYWVQLRGLGECGIKRVQQLAILRYARGPYQPASAAPTYDIGIPQGVVSTRPRSNFFQKRITVLKKKLHSKFHDKMYILY